MIKIWSFEFGDWLLFLVWDLVIGALTAISGALPKGEMSLKWTNIPQKS
jgi:hypothetical protein